MTPQQIKAAIILAGDKQKRIADRLNVTPGAVTQVIMGTFKSKRIRDEIARVIDKKVEDVWPEYAA